MKLLVTGGCGYIGSVATRYFCDKGHTCVVFDNLERGHRQALDPRAQLIVGDLRESSDILLAMRQDAWALDSYGDGGLSCWPWGQPGQLIRRR